MKMGGPAAGMMARGWARITPVIGHEGAQSKGDRLTWTRRYLNAKRRILEQQGVAASRKAQPSEDRDIMHSPGHHPPRVSSPEKRRNRASCRR